MANLPLAFAELVIGAVVIDAAVKGDSIANVVRGAATSHPVAGLSGTTATATAATGAQPAAAGKLPAGSQKQQIAQTAAKYGLSPRTLWGVYGTESSFGSNPSTSSAGAQGPFQFIPSTWAQYGHGSVQDFSASLDAAARYLKSLGANTNPASAGTLSAINNYNGNGGGASSATSYAQSVLHFGGQF